VGYKKALFLFLSGLFCLSLLAGCGADNPKELVIYSARKEYLIKPIVDAYYKETGIKVKYFTDKAGVLLQRLKAEGKQTPADIYLTVDAGNLWKAADWQLLLPVNSSALRANIPSNLRDPDHQWFGFSIRARTIVYNPDRVDVKELSTYEALADEKWRKRLCLRTSKKVYNQSLVAMMIAENGYEKTSEIVRGWVQNLSVPVFSSDTQVLKALLSGQGDVGIVNSYYYGRLLQKDPDLALKIFWPNQESGGVHVNISGAGLVRHSKNPKEALRFLEWLSSEKAQRLFADANLEYPVNPSVEPSKLVRSWGEFEQNIMNVIKAGELQGDAIRLMDKVGYR